MHSWIQLLTTPTADTPGTCLLFHHDNRRYLFGNISEGTQRMMVQRKVPMSKMEEIFLTGPINWHGIGGLLGMVLTLADVARTSQESRRAVAEKKKKKSVAPDVMNGLSLHGGGNLAYLLATARRFIFRKGLPLRPHEITTDYRTAQAADNVKNEPDWQDENIKVWYVPLFVEKAPRSPSRKRNHGLMDSGGSSPAEQTDVDHQLLDSIVKHMFDSDWSLDTLVEATLHSVQLPAKLFVRDDEGHLQPYDGPLPGEADDVPDVPVLVRRPWPGATIRGLPRTSPTQQSMCYIVKNHPRRGKFDPKKAEEFGIPKMMYSLLTKGESAVGKDGITVTPDMVLEPTIEGHGFAIIEIPEPAYIDALLARPEWANDEILSGIEVMVWVLGPGLSMIPDCRSSWAITLLLGTWSLPRTSARIPWPWNLQL